MWCGIDWRCPICLEDIDPATLVMDGFVEKVVRRIRKKGLTGVRDVVVKADEKWEPLRSDDGSRSVAGVEVVVLE